MSGALLGPQILLLQNDNEATPRIGVDPHSDYLSHSADQSFDPFEVHKFSAHIMLQLPR